MQWFLRLTLVIGLGLSATSASRADKTDKDRFGLLDVFQLQ
jgi:hypothetical protein